MKQIFSALVLLTALFSQAQAQTVETTIDGEIYTCRPSSGGSRPGSGNAVDCINMAYGGPFSRTQSETLCQGARNTGPALCAIKAYAGPFSIEESLRFCKGARSAGPVECYLKAYAGPFSREESMNLCKNNPHATVGTAECALEAYRGPYSREEAIKLCAGTRKSKSHLKISFLSHDGFQDLVIKANEKAMAEGLYKK